MRLINQHKRVIFAGLVTLFTVSSVLLFFINWDRNTAINPVNRLRIDTNYAYREIRDDIDFESAEYMDAVEISAKEKIYTTIVDLKGNIIYSNSPYLDTHSIGMIDELFYMDSSYMLSNENAYKIAQPLYIDSQIQGFAIYEKLFAPADKWAIGEIVLIGIIIATFILLIIMMIRIIYSPYPTELTAIEKGLDNMAKGIFTPIKVSDNSRFLSLYNTYNMLAEELMYIMNRKEHNEKQRKVFINKISHELKTPISTIKAYVEGLRNNVAKDVDKQKIYVDVIYEKMNQLTNMVNDFFVYTQEDASHLKYNFTECYANEVVDLIFKNIENQNDDRTVCQNLLPKCIINADINRLEQVILNLYNNSKKHTNKLDMINIGAYREDNNVVIEVSDSGTGIPAGELPYIFDPYYQGDKSKQGDYQGVGLGLAICKSIIEEHNGYIKVKSQIDKGTSMLIYIPIV